MLTQIDIEDKLHESARSFAFKTKTTLKALVNEGLADLLRRKQPAPKPPTRRAAK